MDKSGECKDKSDEFLMFLLIAILEAITATACVGLSLTLIGDTDMTWLAIVLMVGAVTLFLDSNAFYKRYKSELTRTVELVQGALWILLALFCIPLIVIGAQTGKNMWLALVIMGVSLSAGFVYLAYLGER